MSSVNAGADDESVQLSVISHAKREREREKNFSEAEIEIILSEVEFKKQTNILFSLAP